EVKPVCADGTAVQGGRVGRCLILSNNPQGCYKPLRVILEAFLRLRGLGLQGITQYFWRLFFLQEYLLIT
ncbi:MAG: hypothetical protein RIE86_15390, partial [Imperialibacter sp.]|uniref:hypothetical protein n=1 Tax=Imperialibacter sp. TaxID=2038411 RepID=UPI0032EE664C